MKNDKFSDDLELLLEVLPPSLRERLSSLKKVSTIIEFVLDLGRSFEVRFKDGFQHFPDLIITASDIDYVISKVGEFSSDNRAGIERTLHRISAIRNRKGDIIGLTLRVGRAIFGTIEIIMDVIKSGKNILFLGPPGIGKTTKLRESARILADQFNKRVVVVDTSNEIAGDGDIPHPGIGKARRMQVKAPDLQHAVMIEAVENHMPEIIIIDEIGTEAEALAARTIAERGVQLIGTAHGISLENLLNNPTLSDLLGGIQTVILGDDEARRRGTQKAILERKAPPTFDVLVEIQTKDRFAIYHEVSDAVDKTLRGVELHPEIRIRKEDGQVETIKPSPQMPEVSFAKIEAAKISKESHALKIYPFGVNRSLFLRSIKALSLTVEIAKELSEADLVLTTKTKARSGAKIIKLADEHNLPLHVIRGSTTGQIQKFLKNYFKLLDLSDEDEEMAVREAEEAARNVIRMHKMVELSPQNAYLRRLQHQVVERMGLSSQGVGEDPKRRIRIYPPQKS